MTPATLSWLAPLLPLLAAPLVALSGRRPNLREGVTLAFGLATFGLVAALFPAVVAGARPGLHIAEFAPGLSLALKVEPLGLLFALVASSLWIATSLYGAGYMRGHHEENQTRFFAFFAVAIGAALGAAFSGNMLTLFFFYEVLTLSTYPLVTHHRSPEARRSGRIYMGILLGTSICLLLFAVVWTWHLAGTLDFVAGGILKGKAGPGLLLVLLLLYAFGTGKAALMPFHRWLPAAMVAPTPVSALLHAVAVVKAGVFTVLKVCVYVFGIDTLAGLSHHWLVYAASFTMVAASLVALTKDNLKARLAYSTIGQLSYIVLGGALANTLGAVGGGLHIATHAFGKITLFFCAGAIYVAAHKTEISTMRGLGRRMPWTFGAFLVGSLSLIGLPPFAGAWSKWYLVLGSLEAGEWIAVAALLASSLLNILYLLPIAVNAFFTEPPADAGADGEHHDHGEAPLACLLPLLATAAATLVLFFWPDPFLHLARLATAL